MKYLSSLFVLLGAFICQAHEDIAKRFHWRKRFVYGSIAVFSLTALLLPTSIGWLFGARQSEQLLASTEKERNELAEKSRELCATHLALKGDYEKAISEARSLKVSLEKKDEEIRLYANSKEEIKRLQDQLDADKVARQKNEARFAALLKEKEKVDHELIREREQRQESVVALIGEREKVDRDRMLFSQIRQQRDALLSASLVSWLSKVRNQQPPISETISALTRAMEGVEGDCYCLALLADLQGDEKRYRAELARVSSLDTWSVIARMELKGLEGDLEPMMDWLGKAEGQIPIPTKMNSADFSLLLSKHAVCQEAAVRLERKGKPVVQALMKRIQEKNLETRLVAMATLAGIGPRGAEAVPLLIRALEDDKPIVRWQAARSLGWIGPGAQSALPALRARAKDEDASVRAGVERAILRIAPKVDNSIPPRRAGRSVQ